MDTLFEDLQFWFSVHCGYLQLHVVLLFSASTLYYIIHSLFWLQKHCFFISLYVLAFAYYKAQTFAFGFLCSHFWMLIMTNTAWSMMETGGGPSIVFLSNSSLIFLIQASDFFPLLPFCFWLGLGRRGGCCGFTR